MSKGVNNIWFMLSQKYYLVNVYQKTKMSKACRKLKSYSITGTKTNIKIYIKNKFFYYILKCYEKLSVRTAKKSKLKKEP